MLYIFTLQLSFRTLSPSDTKTERTLNQKINEHEQLNLSVRCYELLYMRIKENHVLSHSFIGKNVTQVSILSYGSNNAYLSYACLNENNSEYYI